MFYDRVVHDTFSVADRIYVRRPISWLEPPLAVLSRVSTIYALVDPEGTLITYSAWVTDVQADQNDLTMLCNGNSKGESSV